MKKWIKPFLVMAFFIFAAADTFHDFVSSEPIHYFTQSKSRLLIVASISLLGGFAAFIFDRLSLQNRSRVKLLTLGFLALISTALASYCLISFLTLLFQIGPAKLGAWTILRGFFFMPMWPLAVSIFLWLIFYQTFKRRV